MALHVPRAPGFSSMMKDGARFFSGLEEAVIRNIGEKIKCFDSGLTFHSKAYQTPNCLPFYVNNVKTILRIVS